MAKAIEGLGRAAAETAMRAAAEYVRVHGRTVRDWAAAEETLRRHVRAALPAALADAREALDLGMAAIAQQTFLASMACAGIAAAEEFTGVCHRGAGGGAPAPRHIGGFNQC